MVRIVTAGIHYVNEAQGARFAEQRTEQVAELELKELQTQVGLSNGATDREHAYKNQYRDERAELSTELARAH